MTQIQAYENKSKEALIEHHKHTLQQHADENTSLQKAAALYEKGLEDAITERDSYQEQADNLAHAISKYFGVDIGEHSSANNPWAEALEVISDAAAPAASTVHALSDIDRTELSGAMGLLAGHGYKGSAAAIKRVLDSKCAEAQPPTITLNGYQLLQALETVAPDYQVDTQQLECDARIQYGEGHSGKGNYCWLADYPEEGATLLLDEPTEPCHVVDKTPKTQAFQVDETDKMQDSLVTKPFTACTCPSGDGSLRWPCPVHPPESVKLTKSSNQQVDSRIIIQSLSMAIKLIARAAKSDGLQLASRTHHKINDALSLLERYELLGSPLRTSEE